MRLIILEPGTELTHISELMLCPFSATQRVLSLGQVHPLRNRRLDRNIGAESASFHRPPDLCGIPQTRMCPPLEQKYRRNSRHKDFREMRGPYYPSTSNVLKSAFVRPIRDGRVVFRRRRFGRAHRHLGQHQLGGLGLANVVLREARARGGRSRTRSNAELQCPFWKVCGFGISTPCLRAFSYHLSAIS